MSSSSISDIPKDQCRSPNSGYPKQGRSKRARPRTAGPLGNGASAKYGQKGETIDNKNVNEKVMEKRSGGKLNNDAIIKANEGNKRVRSTSAHHRR